MSEETYFRYSPAVVLVPMFLVLVIWSVFLLELRLDVNLNEYGIYPRRLSGLKGIFLSPFIHGSVEHLYNNTIPLVILLASLLYFYRSIAFRVLFLGLLLSGILTWLIGRPAYHIGASGMIYMLASFIFFKGIRTRHYRLVAVSLTVVFIYGGLLWYIFPVMDEISWEGHLGGFISGLVLAFTLHAGPPPPPRYAWEEEDYPEEEDEFLQQFDEEGNFKDPSPSDPDSPAEGGEGIASGKGKNTHRMWKIMLPFPLAEGGGWREFHHAG